jgi:hypothetical protein
MSSDQGLGWFVVEGNDWVFGMTLELISKIFII